MASRILLLLALLLGALAPAAAAEGDLRARLEALADQGHAEAAYHLGMIHHLGLDGAAQDHRRALEYFRRSAEQGDPLGAYKLGCYYAGQGGDALAPDGALALRYKLIAAEAGYALAQFDVGRIHAALGEHERALFWYEAAARQGHRDALFMALMSTMAGAPGADPVRHWLYTEVVLRTLETAPAGVLSADEMEAMRQTNAMMRHFADEGLSDADRERGRQLLAGWQVERSALTARADQGLEAARELVGRDRPGS